MEIKIFFNNKFIISSLSEYKYNKNQFNIVEKNIDELSCPQVIVDLLESYDVIKVKNIEDKELLERLQNIFIPIYADGGVVKNSKNETLMIYRNGYWDLPKGKREKGESSRECAVREVEEECGIKVDSTGTLVCKTHHIYFMFNKWIIKETAWYNMISLDNSTPIPQTEEGITQIKWISNSSLKDYYNQSYATIVEVLQLVRS